MKVSNRTAAVFLTLLLAGPAEAVEDTQSCNVLLRSSTPVARYRFDAGPAFAEDEQLGLMWQRCPEGFALEDGDTPDLVDDDVCAPTGDDVDLTFQQALQAAETLNGGGGGGGFTNWRVPNIHELATINEYRCHHPTLNLNVFPTTEDFTLFKRFWSSTVEPGLTFVGPIALTWEFRTGLINRQAIDTSGFFAEPFPVRLVRSTR